LIEYTIAILLHGLAQQ